ncbi:hypothetical protein QOZ80_7AG0558730 [Eleusine coracana subsp. coracana]|nr:hypothetical protein QOZ80_7AG0558730 [Eleusine coracana subsp. coracana]
MDMCDNETPGYIVCNPATERWALVPSSGCIWTALEEPLFEDSDDDGAETNVATYLIFDPAISQHFQLIEFCHTSELGTVHTYSSETGLWNDRTRQRREWKRGGKWEMHKTITSMSGSIFFNKMLHLVIIPRKGRELIAAIDGEGKTCKTIRWLENHSVPVFVGESKGLLHCVSVSGHPEGNSCNMTELSMWVLEDYCAEEWKLKHTVSFSEFFGKTCCQFGSDYNVVTIRPDHNLVFFVQHWDYKLISYDMDHKEVCHLCTVGCDYGRITPYFPYFLESPVLLEKQRTE